MNIKKKRISFPILLILLGACLIAYAAISIRNMRPALQYLALAPKPVETGEGTEKRWVNQDLLKWLDRFEDQAEALSDYVSKLTISAAAPDTAFLSDEDLQLTGTLHGVGMNYFSVYPRTLIEGRLFYDDELKWGEPACLIDEKAAVELFRTTRPLGRVLTIGGNEYRIVGVLRSESRVGMASEYNVYVPIRQLARESIELETIMVSARPLPGAGAAAAFASRMSGWARGEAIDVEKEGMRALLPVRLTLFIAGISLVGWCARWWTTRLRRRIDALRAELQRVYFETLLPRVALTVLEGVLGFACLAGAGFLLISMIVQPVYTFTEWVPKVPVEWSEIASTYWNAQSSAAKTISLRSAELLRVRHFGAFVIAGFALMTLSGLYLVVSAHVIRRFEAQIEAGRGDESILTAHPERAARRRTRAFVREKSIG